MSVHSNRKISPQFLRILLIFAISLACGLAWYFFLYGRYPLYPSNVNWIYAAGGDSLKAQLGWEWFRQEPWHFPIGRIENYAYPVGTSLSFMDSIPLMAILSKLVSPLLDSNFQYLGAWELLSLVMQMFFGMLILGEFTSSYRKRIFGASLLVLSPVLLNRAFFHVSLSAQWILLAAIWFIVLEYRKRLWRWSWLVLFAVTMLIHLYFVAMLLPLWGISLFFRYRREKRFWQLALDVLAVAGIILAFAYCLGLFGLSLTNLRDSGFGYYSWNLNGFINPFNNSAIFKMITSSSEGGQYEGFSYLGLGNLFLFVIALVFFYQKEYSKDKLPFILPFVIVSILLALFALSNKAYLNSQLLYDIKLSEKIQNVVSMFRSSGRFIWPVYYFIILFGLISSIRNIRYVTPILILGIMLQLIDIQPLYSSKKQTAFAEYQSPLQSEFWQAAAKVNTHVVVLPTIDTPASLNAISIYARQNNLTLNWGYFSRVDLASTEDYARNTWKDLLNGLSDSQTVYLFWEPEYIDQADKILSDSMLVCTVDGYKIAISQDNPVNQSGIDLSNLCSMP